MKKILSLITAFSATLWAAEDCSVPGNQTGDCEQTGYVCNLGFNVVGADNIMFFQLGADAACTYLLTSDSLKTYKSMLDTTYSDYTRFYLWENKNSATPLSLTLAGSLAMLAINNGLQVDIIYRKVDNIEYGGIKLQSIRLISSNNNH